MYPEGAVEDVAAWNAAHPDNTPRTVMFTVNSNTPNVSIVDKNAKEPDSPTKVEDQTYVVVGDTVNYVSSVKAVNYQEQTQGTQIRTVTSYKFTDTYELGLDSVVIDSVQYYTTPAGEDGTWSGSGTDIPASGDNAYTVTYGKTTNDGEEVGQFTINIPWAVKDGTDNYMSLYPSPVYIVVKYHMTVTSAIYAQKDHFYADNTMKITYRHETSTTDETITGTPKVRVNAVGISLHKFATGHQHLLLHGAQFRVYKIENDTIKWYLLDNTTKEVTWVDTEYNVSADTVQASVLTADNSFDTVEIYSLEPDTYYLKEIKAPEGYQLPAAPFTFTVSYSDKDTTKNADDETGMHGKYSVTFQNEDVTDTAGSDIKTLMIANGAGSPMPTTGGAGTVLLIAGGAFLFLATGVILVTKKRMYNRG